MEALQIIKRKHRRKPTIRQILALKYINQGMSKRKAMMKAGYKASTASNPSDNLMDKKGTARILDTMKAELVNEGLVPKYMAQKFAKWMEAKKIEHSHTGPDIEVEDNEFQLKAFKEWQKIMGIQETDSHVRRKLTIEEFIKGTE